MSHSTVTEAWERAMLVPLELLMFCLPYRTDNIRDTAMLGRATDNKGWSCVYRDIVCIEPTAKEAVVAMLGEHGVLDKVQEQLNEIG